MARKILVFAVTAAALWAAAFSSAGTTRIFEFRLPSKNIACAYAPSVNYLRCDIFSGLKPKPHGSCREGDWSSIFLPKTRRARPGCISDSVYNPNARVLRYGHTWKKGPYTCRSKRVGLRCRNRSGHGFFLSRQRWAVH
jgi:hypothetical protein